MLVANILVKPDFKENNKVGTTDCDLTAVLHKGSSAFIIIGQIFDDRFQNHSKAFCRGTVVRTEVTPLITAAICELDSHTSGADHLLTSLAIAFGFV